MTDELDELLEETKGYEAGGDLASDPAAVQIRRLRREAAKNRVEKNEVKGSLAQQQEAISQLQQQLDAARAETAAKAAEVEQRGKTLEDVLKGIEASNGAVIASLPEELRVIVPQGLDPVATRRWLDAAVPVLAKQKKPVPPTDGESGSRGKDQSIPQIGEDELSVARALGLKPEEYLANKRSK